LTALQALYYELRGLLWLEGPPTCEYVNCGIAMLRPCMDAQVGLGDGNDAGNTTGIKLVEGPPNDSGAGLVSGADHRLLDVPDVIQKLLAAISQLQ